MSQLIFISLFLLGSIARPTYGAWGMEAEWSGPLASLAWGTEDNEAGLAARYYFAETYHAGLEGYFNGGESAFGSSVSVGGNIGVRTAPTSLYGLSLGYYLNGYEASGFKFMGSAGFAMREFRDSEMGTVKDDSYYYSVEAGYNFMFGNGYWGPSLMYWGSGLEKSAAQTNGVTTSTISKNPYAFVSKLVLGFIF